MAEYTESEKTAMAAKMNAGYNVYQDPGNLKWFIEHDGKMDTDQGYFNSEAEAWAQVTGSGGDDSHLQQDKGAMPGEEEEIDETTLAGEWEYNRYGHFTLTWDDGRELYIQDESSALSFINDLGYEPDDMLAGDHDKIPDSVNWDYWNVAEESKKKSKKPKRFNPDRPTREYWRKVFPGVKASLKKSGWKGRGAATLDEAAAAVTADMWYHKIKEGTKEYYEIMRQRREGK